MLIPLFIFVFLFRHRYLVPLLIFFLSLQCTSIVNITSINYGLQAYRLLCMLISIRLVLDILKSEINGFADRLGKIANPLLVFMSYSIIISIVGPLLFKGILVCPPQLGIDYCAIHGPLPLKMSMYNMGFPFFILFYVLVFIYLSLARLDYSILQMGIKAFLVSMVLVMLLAIYQFISYITGLPDILAFFNVSAARHYNLSYFSVGGIVLPRITSTFFEPSMLSPFACGVFSFYLVRYIEGGSVFHLLIALISMVIIFISTSTTAYVATVVGLLVLLALCNIPKVYLRELFFSREYMGRSLFLVFFMFGIGAILVWKVGFIREIISIFVLEKRNTGSFSSRLFTDMFALSIFKNSLFLGVGLGSTRSSSLLPHSLSTIGFMGTASLFLFLYRLSKYSYAMLKDSKYFPFFFLVPSLIIAQLVGYSDITNPTFWQFLYILIIVLRMRNEDLCRRSILQMCRYR